MGITVGATWGRLLLRVMDARGNVVTSSSSSRACPWLEIYLPSESHIKLNQINAKGGLPEEQTRFWLGDFNAMLICAVGRSTGSTIVRTVSAFVVLSVRTRSGVSTWTCSTSPSSTPWCITSTVNIILSTTPAAPTDLSFDWTTDERQSLHRSCSSLLYTESQKNCACVIFWITPWNIGRFE